MSMNNEEEDYTSAAERHSQIMAEGAIFFRRLAWGVIGTIVIIVGTIIFFFVREYYHGP